MIAEKAIIQLHAAKAYSEVLDLAVCSFVFCHGSMFLYLPGVSFYFTKAVG